MDKKPLSAQNHPLKGRGAHSNPPNRFEKIRIEDDWEQIEEGKDCPTTQYLPDATKSIVTENNSPDIPFRYSVNPYRGCSHGCAYCYARPTHEYLGLGAGLDFETKILVKRDAPRLLREFLGRSAWQPEPIIMSGVTDCYQPAEREFRLTRGCLEVALEARQPIGIITKNALVVRELDLLREMAARGLVHVNLSITTLDVQLARAMEPRTSTPAAKLAAIRKLADAGVPVRAMVAPIIPSLTDSEIPQILAAVKEAGASAAGFTLVRLPLAVKPIFLEWLQRELPLAAQRIKNAIRATHEGKMNNSQFGERLSGSGVLAGQIKQLFSTFSKKHGLDGDLPKYDVTQFRPPRPERGQLRLF